MRRWPVIVLALAVVSSSGTAFYLYSENVALRRELAARSTGLADSTDATATAANGASADGVDQTVPAGEDASAAVAPAVVEMTPATPPTENRRGGGDERRERGLEAAARALNDPDARQAMLGRAKTQVDRQFGDLFVRLGLGEEQVEALRTMLAERQLVQNEAGLLQRAAADEHGREEARVWQESKLASLQAGIESVLGPAGLQMLQDYQRSTPQRQVVEDIARRASYLGAPLSGEASDQLVRVLQQVQTELPIARELARNGSPTGGRQFTAEAANEYLAAREAQNNAVLAQAKAFLTQQQLEALADKQIEEMEQLQAAVNFRARNPDLRGGDFGGFGRGGGGPGDGGFRGGPGPRGAQGAARPAQNASGGG